MKGEGRRTFLTGAGMAVGLIVGLLASVGVAAQEGSSGAALPQIVGIRVGFDGHYKVGVWTPVEVVLRGGKQPVAGRVSIVVPDGEGVASRTSTPDSRPCQVEPGVEARFVVYARFGRVHSEATVSFEMYDGASVQRQFGSSAEPGADEYPPAMSTDRKLILCVSSSPLGLEEAAGAMGGDPEKGPVVVRLDDPAKLPGEWYGYEGVDAVVVATDRPETYERPSAENDPSRAALDRWIQLGGRLLVVTTPRRSADALETPPVRTVRGFGQLTVLAVRPEESRSDWWGDRGSRLAQLLDWPKPAEESSTGAMTAAHLGFTDVSGQLRGALDRFDGVTTVPFGVVVAVLVVYLVLVGPIDYWILARLKRLTWTWVTFPLLIVIFAVGAYAAVHHLKGTELRLNQADLVDVDVASGLVRGTHWSNLYSPRVDTYDLALRPRMAEAATAKDDAVVFAWLGLPGSGLGGMDPKTVNPNPWRVAYRFSPALDEIDGLPMQTWSTRSFTGRWSGTWKGEFRTEIVRRDDEPGGRLANPLGVELKRCLLIYDRWVYDLGTLGPGETVLLDVLPERTELRTLLTGSQRVMDDKNDRMELRVTPYNALSVDVPYILRTMMFFEHAGGSSYTHLSNQYQSFVDLSYLLGPDRAMLVGIADGRAATVCRDGKPLDEAGNRRLTFYRFVIPVVTRDE